MGYEIRKAGVIGAGTMGSGIAALLVGMGLEVVLLDVPSDAAEGRNTIVLAGLERMRTARPPALFAEGDIERIQVGNLEDDLHLLADVDWVIEAVVENVEVKRALFAKLTRVVRPDTIFSTNTSGLPVGSIAEGMDAGFKRRFIGTHFFNPPRYLKLLEIIPTGETEAELTRFMLDFGARVLDKGVVLCKDRPNFIGNRLSSFFGSFVRNYALDEGFTVEEIDALTGTLIGRPATATFRLQDLVGLDTSRFVVQNLYPAIPDDPAREVLKHPKMTALAAQLIERKWLGNKTGQGFYKAVKDEAGNKVFWVLNLETLAYAPPTTPIFESVERHKEVEDTGERIRLLMQEDDRAGRFLWHMHGFYLAYASNRVPEITDSLVNIDKAARWGFNHQLGPFQIWDAIGVEAHIPAFEAAGYPVAEWVKQMVSDGCATFYQRDDNGNITGYYDLEARTYLSL